MTNNQTFLFVCVYLPFDCDINYDDYCFCLNKINCINDTVSTPYVFILGDFNAKTLFRKKLIDFCDFNHLCFIDQNMLVPNNDTFVCQAYGSTSWLDHCITTSSSQTVISNMLAMILYAQITFLSVLILTVICPPYTTKL